MLKNIFHTLFALFVLIATASAQVQINDKPIHSFNYLTTANGLESNTILAIHQDAAGFMWFGTSDGLYKYDGIKLHLVKRFFLEDKCEISFITETQHDHKLWLLVANKLFTLQLQTEKIEEVKLPFEDYIMSIFTDREDRLWVCSYRNGVYKLDTTDGCFKKWDELPTLTNQYVVQIIQRPDGTYYFLSPGVGMVSYNSETGETATYHTDNLNVSSCFIDSKERIWLGTWNGFYGWNNTMKKFEKVDLGNHSKRNVFAISKILAKSADELYIATDSGLFIYRIRNGNVTHYKANVFKTGYLKNNYINDMYIDNEHTLWLGTYFGGVNYITKSSKNFMSYDFINRKMDGHVVSSFTEGKDGSLWITTEDGGLSFYNKKTNEVTNYNPFNSPNPYVDFFNVHTIEVDKDNLYIGMSSAGLNIVNLKTKEVRKIGTKSPVGYRLHGMSILSMIKVAEKFIAIGTLNGLDLYDIQTGKIEHVNEIPNKEITDLSTDQDDNLWVCVAGLGAFKRDKNGKWTDLCKDNVQLANVQINRIAVDEERVYFGTKYQGLICYNQKDKSYEKILSEELAFAIINCIIPKDNTVWIGTTNGLYVYNFELKSSKHFTERHGLKSKCIYRGILAKDGTIFVGTTNGLNGFKPEELFYGSDQKGQRTVFTSLKVNNEEMTTQTEHSLLQKIISYTDHITLAHDQSNISIEFSQLSYTNWNDRTYRYKLSPIDKEWDITKSNTLNFKQLPPEEYTLTVQSKNSDGTWENEGKSLKITILPPWWATWQMYTLYVLLIIGLIIYFIFSLRRKQERRIKEINAKKKEEIYQSKMKFFTNVIHDIRTPLTLILSPLEELRSRKETEAFQNELTMMSRNGKRLLNNVNQLMDFQKMEKGDDTTVVKEPINIIQELAYLKEDFQSMAESKYIAINILTDKDLPKVCYIKGNKNMFDKVFTNLVANALKFTSNYINISISQQDDRYVIAVEDNGIGISKELQERIFEPFFQIKEKLPHDYIGTGIGLAIVKNTVDKLGGTLSLTSETGKGSTFFVALPVAQVTAEEVADSEGEAGCEVPHEPVPTLEIEQEGDKSPWKIAVAEDNEDMRQFIVSILSPHYQVHAYANGQELYDDMENVSFDLVLSDVMMPVLNGYELCNKIKDNSQSCHIPVILLTAKIMENDEIEGLDSGADAYIRKPFSKDVLLARIRNLIKNREKITAGFIHDPEVKIGEIIQNEKDKEFIEKLNNIIEKNMNKSDLSAQMVASELCMCRALFFSKMKAVSGVSFTNYVRIARLKKAIELMKTGKYTLLEISKEVGFSSLSYFSKSFKQQFDITPSEYIKKF